MSSTLYRFGPFEIDPGREELRRAGMVLRLPRQPFRILLLLVGRAGQVVSREEIQTAIWGDETYVDFEHGINSAIRQIRFVLGDQAETPRYVRTLPRRGYSFVASVECVARPGQPELVMAPPRRVRHWPRIAAIAAAMMIAAAAMFALIAQARRAHDVAPPAGHAIAVLPFRRIGPAIAGLDERSFAAELRATIGRLPRERISLTDAAPRADFVIDGTIRPSGDGVRVIVSVAEAASRTQIWSETFQRPLKLKEGMAVDVAHRVMREVAFRFLPPARREPILMTRTSAAAMAQYRQARLLHARAQAYDWMRTKALYEAAIRQDPRFAEAWSGVSDVWVGQAVYGPPAGRASAAAQAAACARRAIALQPRNVEALSTLGVLASQYDYNLAAAEDLMRRATSADPAYVDARVNLAMVLAMRGQADESLREYARAQQIDPIGLDLNPIEPMLYFQARRYEDARARYRDILAVDPQSRAAIFGLLSACIVLKNWSEGIAAAAMLRDEPVADVPATEAAFLKIYRALDFQRGMLNSYTLAVYRAQLGDRDQAFALLGEAIDAHNPIVSYIMVDPRWDALRNDPRFSVVLARMSFGRPPSSS